MKKTYVLKPKYRKVVDGAEEVLMVVALLGIIYLLHLGLKAQDERNYKYAIERCGSVENLVENHTKEGDTYWTCKIDK